MSKLNPRLQTAIDRLNALPRSCGAVSLVMDRYFENGLQAAIDTAENLAEIMETVVQAETGGLHGVVTALSRLAVEREQRKKAV